MTDVSERRRRQRDLAAQHSALIDMLDQEFATTDLPNPEWNDRKIGAWIGQRQLVEWLKKLRQEASGVDHKVIGG